MVDSLMDAFTEGDKKRQEGVDDNARKVSDTLKLMSTVPGEHDVAARRTKGFDACFAPAIKVVRISPKSVV